MAGLPVRSLLRQALRSASQTRHISSTRSQNAAQNFAMPAMSPTMTEGNIASWKVKEGDKYAAGDILLEIETDKASMDVEAQDDGIMAKIFIQDGAKGVKVGTRIAVLAEEGDDISSLDIPEDDSKPVEKPKENVKRDAEAKEDKKSEDKGKAETAEAPKGTPPNKRVNRNQPKTSPEGPGQNPKYPMYPSVQALILAKQIPDDEVLKIAATGPGGRLLKGDVLAYLGAIDSDYSKKQSESITKRGHLDLSNIKVAEQKPISPAKAAGKSEPEAEPPRVVAVNVPISLAEVLKVQQRIQSTLGTHLPLSSFLARAVDAANDDLPLTKGIKPSSNDLFNAVLGLDTIPTTSRGTYLPQINALATPNMSSMPRSRNTRPIQKPVDIIDILSGKAKPARSVMGRQVLAGAGSAKPITSTTPPGAMADGAINIFSLVVPQEEEKRARTFLERVKTILQVEPGRLVL